MCQCNIENTHSTEWGRRNILSGQKFYIYILSRFLCRFNDMKQRFCKKLTLIKLAMQNASKQSPKAKSLVSGSVYHLTSGDPNYSQCNEIQMYNFRFKMRSML